MEKYDIDIDAVMDDIYKQAKEYEQTPLEQQPPIEATGPTPPTPVQPDAATVKIQQARQHENVLVERSFDSSGLSATMKKVIRKMIRFLIVPIIQDQNEFNKEVVDALEQLKEQQDINATEQKINTSLKPQYEHLNAYVNRDITKALKHTQQACERLEQENAQLKAELNSLKQRVE